MEKNNSLLLKNESDEKRLKSLMEKKMAFKMREGLIREALNAVDQKPLGKKIIFSDDIDSSDKIENGSIRQKRLFDDDTDNEGGDTLEDNTFKIRENVNKKLRALQSNFGNDKRFTLDDRFAEDDNETPPTNTEPSSELHEERDWQLDILQDVLGKPMKMTKTDDTIDRRKKGMIRYDPTKNEHVVNEIPVKNQIPKKKDKMKKVLDENDFNKDKPPELSKDIFFKVSDNLVDALKQDEQFSLLKTFGTEVPSTDTNNEKVAEKMNGKDGHQFNFNTKNPFKYDSSDNESVNEEKITNIEKIESKHDWNDSLFFDTDDVRFEDARKFFNKQTRTDSEFSTLRRNLKQIVKSKIQNNLRKKVAWKKIKNFKSR